MSLPKSMKAVVFDGPRKVSIQDRPVPQLQNDTDVIVKVHLAALCGSELHVFRGHQPSATGFIMGHEFTGEIVSIGSAVRTLNIGDKIVCPFTTSCGDCFYCQHGSSSRCSSSTLFGSPRLDGSQASYVLIPHADATALPCPPALSDSATLLMADIFPTGYYAVRSALSLLPSPQADSVMVIVGCGPVGLCAIAAAAALPDGQRPKHLFAVDAVEDRLQRAAALGAQALSFKDWDALVQAVKGASGGRGADMVVEAVGNSPALRTAFDLVRPFGVISSIGVHNAEIPWSGNEAYGKNIRLQMGRCPVRSIFNEALEVLAKQQHLLDFMFENVMPLTDAVKGYALFDEMKVQKVIFKPE